MYCIEGNIGVGKSTLMKHLSNVGYICFSEPIEKWTLLEDFYKNQKDFAFPFQMQVLTSQYDIIKNINKMSENCFVERCPWTSKNVFIEMMKENNIWTKKQSVCYDALYEKIDQNIKKIFYLDLDIETCMERIKQRNRFEEKNISIEYVNKLDLQYKKALSSSNYKVYIINVKNKTTAEIAYEILNYI